MATLSNAEIQKKALEELQCSSESSAISTARAIINDIAYQQSIIMAANKQIVELKDKLSKVTIKDYSVVVA